MHRVTSHKGHSWPDLACLSDLNSLRLPGTVFYECVLSCFSHVQLFETLRRVVRQSPLSMGFSRQEDWTELPFPPPGESSWLRDRSWFFCIAGGFFTAEPLGKYTWTISGFLNMPCSLSAKGLCSSSFLYTGSPLPLPDLTSLVNS